MINSVRFFCIFEDGSFSLERIYSEKQDLSVLGVDYLNFIKEAFSLDAVSVTIMVEVKTTTRSRSAVFGHFLIQGGVAYSVTSDFLRIVRECNA